MRGSVRRWVPGAAVAAALASTLLAFAPAALASGLPAPASGLPVGRASLGYVALGDSYTAGPLIPNQSLNPLGCLRSSANYPADTASALGLSLTDVSCSGATTGNMYNPQNVTPGPANPPQLSVVTSATSVVTLQIGGNDVGFSSIIQNCAAYTPWGPTKVGQNCQSYYDPGGNDQLGAAIAALEPTIAAVLKQIHVQAPSAKVFVVGYPAILPNTGSCWPSLPLEASDAKYLRSKEIQLDGVLKAAATLNRAFFVNTYTASETHNSCTPEGTRWVEPLFPGTTAAPVHPNALGMAGVAGLLETAMKAHGIA